MGYRLLAAACSDAGGFSLASRARSLSQSEVHVRKLVALFLLGLAGLVAASALADNPHPPGCTGNPHVCTTTAGTTTTATVTATAPAETVTAPAQTVTQTVTLPAQTTTVTKTVVKTRVKKVRRYCTRQRHGWRCTARPPHTKRR